MHCPEGAVARRPFRFRALNGLCSQTESMSSPTDKVHIIIEGDVMASEIFAVRTGQEVQTPEAIQVSCPRRLAFAAREHVVTESDGAIAKVCAVCTGQVVQTLAGHADSMPPVAYVRGQQARHH